MEIVLALGSALAYGVSDFTGGVLSKRAHVFTVILISQLVSCALLLLALPVWAGSFSGDALGWGAAAGVMGVSGAALLYRGLAIGRMGVVAPITAVLAAAIPLTFGLITGERPGSVALIGVIVGLVAVVLISMSPEPVSEGGDTSRESGESGGARGPGGAREHHGHQKHRVPQAIAREALSRPARGIAEAVGAGVGFGLFFILLERTPTDSGLWPLVGTRISMLAAVGLLVAIGSASLRPPTGTGQVLILLGVTNLGADLLFLLATRSGLLSLVAVITSLYPAATVALARVLLNERMVRQQLIGVALAAVSVTLIALR
jgi:drug/metabolite transporter (DMT)-like permease